MRTFIYIDVAIQTFILCAAIILAVITLIENSIESIALIAMYGAFFLGPWQMLSSVITCSLRWMFLKWRLIHLISAAVYLVIFCLLIAFTDKQMFSEVVMQIGVVLGFAVPAALAIFYYNITVKSFRVVRSERSKA